MGFCPVKKLDVVGATQCPAASRQPGQRASPNPTKAETVASAGVLPCYHGAEPAKTAPNYYCSTAILADVALTGAKKHFVLPYLLVGNLPSASLSQFGLYDLGTQASKRCFGAKVA